MAKRQYGFGFSPLSVNNRTNGFDEEMVSVKDCGLFGIMDVNKNVVSGEYLARSRVHLDRFVNRLINDNTVGKLYKITVDDNLVRAVYNEESVLANSLIYDYQSVKINAFRFDFDIDLIMKQTSGIIHDKDVKISIDFGITKGTERKTFNVEESMSNINSKAFKVDYSLFSDDRELYIFTIDGIKIIPPETFDSANQAIILHDILLCIM